MHSLEYVQGHAESKTGCTRAVRYMPQALAEHVYLHPQSALSKAAPEFVVYTQILRTDKRPYLAGRRGQTGDFACAAHFLQDGCSGTLIACIPWAAVFLPQCMIGKRLLSLDMLCRER